MVQRSSLVPYFYGLVRQAFDTGLSPIFPKYYNFPELPNAYLTNPTVLPPKESEKKKSKQ